MSSFGEHHDPWLEQELKNVPLPEGMLARLKEIATGPDALLDQALCAVEPPHGLLSRLKQVPRDEAFDAALRNVSVPAELMGRLHEISAYGDREIDAQLCAVEPSEQLVEQLRAIPRRSRLRPQWTWSPAAAWALAASLVIGVGLWYFRTMIVPQATTPGGAVVAENAPPAPAAGEKIHLTEPPASEFFAEQPAPAESAAAPERIEDRASPLPEPSPSVLAQVEQLLESGAARPQEAAAPPAAAPRRELITATAVPDDFPELEVVRTTAPRGVAAPRVKAFDLLALLKDGVHPFVQPSAHPQLEVSHVPLVTRSTSYQRMRGAVEQGRLLDPSEVRVEEFLAAVDYDFPPPLTAALGVRTAAGPSPFGDEGQSLLQVGVQAGASPLITRQVAHLTLAIDISASMNRGERLASIRRAIADFVPHMGPRDQLAVVVFSEQAEVLINGAQRDDIALILPALESLRPRSSTNLGAGLQLAAEVSRQAPVDARVARRLAVLTDGLGQIPQSAVAQLQEFVAQTAAQGVQFAMIDVGPDAEVDPQLELLAQAAGAHARQAEGAEALRYVLQETLTGHSQVVARAAQLTVKFNPSTVASYRLLGHEPEALGGLGGGVEKTDLRGGEAASALYELTLKPTGGDDVALVLLTWHDPQTGIENRVTQRISRLQFATSLEESPVSLQRAAVVAEVAEIFRHSRFAPQHALALQRVEEVAAQLAAPSWNSESFQQFLDLVAAAQQLRTRP